MGRHHHSRAHTFPVLKFLVIVGNIVAGLAIVWMIYRDYKERRVKAVELLAYARKTAAKPEEAVVEPEEAAVPDAKARRRDAARS
jgi:hypothetical protein